MVTKMNEEIHELHLKKKGEQNHEGLEEID